MRYDRVKHAACSATTKHASEGCIVVTGSFVPEASKKAEMYNIATDEWTTLPDLRKRRVDHGMCAIGSTVYVFYGS